VDLSYDFVMPYPGRRALPDVQGYLVGMCEAMDPNGVNIPLRRALLTWALGPTGIPNVGKLVEESIPEEGMEGGIGPDGFMPQQDPAAAALAAIGAGGGLPGAEPAGRDGAARVRRRSGVPDSQEAHVPQELRVAIGEFEAQDTERFRALVTGPAMAAMLRLGAPEPAMAAANGSGG
jgi:hypothetical protein